MFQTTPHHVNMSHIPPGSGVGFSSMPDYGALASQFMTGGQMGYMPQAQYMTAPQYGAFRSATPGWAMAQQQQPSMWQTYLQANQGRLPFMPASTGMYHINVYNPAIDQTRNAIMARRRLEDMKSAAFASMIDMAPMAAAAALPFGFAGAIGAGLLMPSMSAPFIDRLRTSREVQNLSMSRIIGGQDLAQGLGQGFTYAASRGLDRSIRQQAAQDVIFKEGDFRDMYRLGIESGMFDYSNDANQYKDMIKKLNKNVKAMMQIFESGDMNEIFDNLQRMQRMGAGQEDFKNVALTTRTTSRMLGISMADAISTHGQQGSLIYSQMGLTPYQGSIAGLASAAHATMAQRMGIGSVGAWARMGGAGGYSQQVTQTGAAFDSQFHNMMIPFLLDSSGTKLDQDKVQRLMSGQYSITDITRGASNQLAQMMQGGYHNIAKFMGNLPDLQEQFNKQFDGDMFAGLQWKGTQALMMADQLGLGAMDNYTKYHLGFQAMGYGDELSKTMAEQFSRPDYIENLKRQQRIQQQQDEYNQFLEQYRSQRSISGRMSRWFNTTRENFGQFMYERFSGGKDDYERDYNEWSQTGQNFRRNYGIVFDIQDPFNSQVLERILGGGIKDGVFQSSIVKELEQQLRTFHDPLMRPLDSGGDPHAQGLTTSIDLAKPEILRVLQSIQSSYRSLSGYGTDYSGASNRLSEVARSLSARLGLDYVEGASLRHFNAYTKNVNFSSTDENDFFASVQRAKNQLAMDVIQDRGLDPNSAEAKRILQYLTQGEGSNYFDTVVASSGIANRSQDGFGEYINTFVAGQSSEYSKLLSEAEGRGYAKMHDTMEDTFGASATEALKRMSLTDSRVYSLALVGGIANQSRGSLPLFNRVESQLKNELSKNFSEEEVATLLEAVKSGDPYALKAAISKIAPNLSKNQIEELTTSISSDVGSNLERHGRFSPGGIASSFNNIDELFRFKTAGAISAGLTKVREDLAYAGEYIPISDTGDTDIRKLLDLSADSARMERLKDQSPEVYEVVREMQESYNRWRQVNQGADTSEFNSNMIGAMGKQGIFSMTFADEIMNTMQAAKEASESSGETNEKLVSTLDKGNQVQIELASATNGLTDFLKGVFGNSLPSNPIYGKGTGAYAV